MLIAFAASGVLGLAAVVSGDRADVGRRRRRRRRRGRRRGDAGGRLHVQDGRRRRAASTSRASTRRSSTTPTPPSNGSHYFSPAIWDFYTTAANPIQVVHNEEHGGVIIWWGDKVPQATVEKLHDFYNESPNGMLGTPYPKLGNKVAITAWTAPAGGTGEGRVAVCTAFNEDAFTAFRDAFRGKGPERFPVDTPDAWRVARRAQGYPAAAPGWRNWRYAADLKSAAPTGA